MAALESQAWALEASMLSGWPALSTALERQPQISEAASQLGRAASIADSAAV